AGSLRRALAACARRRQLAQGAVSVEQGAASLTRVLRASREGWRHGPGLPQLFLDEHEFGPFVAALPVGTGRLGVAHPARYHSPRSHAVGDKRPYDGIRSLRGEAEIEICKLACA